MFNLLRITSDYSFLCSTIRIDKLCKRAKKYGYKSLAITESNNLYSSVKFFKKCKELELKPILGCSLNIEDNQGYVVLLAKNLLGWKALIKIVSQFSPDYNFRLEKIAEIGQDNLIVYGGGLGSHLTKAAFNDYKKAIKYNKELSGFDEKWSENINREIERYKKLFGENFYIELQKFENDKIHSCLALYNYLKHNDFGVKKFANFSPFYLDSEDAEDQRILLCSKEQTSLENVQRKIELNEANDLLRFFKHSNYYFYKPEEIESLHDKEEIDVVDEIVSKIEDFDILSPPKFPNFNCPDGFNNETYLKELCEIGWKEKIEGKIDPSEFQKYKARLDEELETFLPIGLAPYFLIVWDIVNWGQKQGWIITARGSAGGCLVSFLLGLTESDPVKYNLLFTRFFNVFRDSPAHISFDEKKFIDFIQKGV